MSDTIEVIDREQLLEKVQAMRDDGYRPVQISATRFPEQVELTYSFDRHGNLTSLRVLLPATDARVPSISGIFGCAILYENEMYDLFKIQVEGMAVDFKGNFYQTAVKFPFALARPPAKAPAAAKSTPSSPVAPTTNPAT